MVATLGLMRLCRPRLPTVSIAHRIFFASTAGGEDGGPKKAADGEEGRIQSVGLFTGMVCPSDRVYSRSHFWIKHVKPSEQTTADGGGGPQVAPNGEVLLGLSHHLWERLGADIVRMDIAPIESELSDGDDLIYVQTETTNTVLFSPIDATLLETNPESIIDPSILSRQPYGDGWIARLQLADPTRLNEMMLANEYEKYFERSREESHVDGGAAPSVTTKDDTMGDVDSDQST